MISLADIGTLQTLAGEAGIPASRLEGILVRADVDLARDSSRRGIVLAGRRNVLPALAERIWGKDLAAEIAAAAGRPVMVAGSRSSWTGLAAKPPRGGLEALAIAADARPDALAREELRVAAPYALAVLATDMRAPLNADDEAMLRELVQLAVLLRIVWVRRPGVEASARDLSDLEGMALARARDAGFGAGRYLGAAFVDIDVGAPLAKDEVSRLAAWDEAQLRAQAREPARRELADFIADVERAHPTADLRPELPLSESDRRRLQRSVDGHIAALGRDLDRHVGRGDVRDTDGLRRLALSSIERWLGGNVLEASDFVYAEKGSPGLMAAFSEAAHAAVESLRIEGGEKQRARHALSALQGHALQMGTAVAAGVVVLAVALAFLKTLIPELVAWVAAIAAGALAAGYVMRRDLGWGSGRSPGAPQARVVGFEPTATALSAAFARLVERPGNTPRERLADIRRRLMKDGPG